MPTLADIAVTTEVYQRFLFFPEDESAIKLRERSDLGSSILSDRNIIGLCTQFKYVEGKATDVPTITFIVVKKKSRSRLRKGQHFDIPPELPAFDPKKGRFSREVRIRTDIEESGGISLCARPKRGIYIDRKRPVSGGLSIGNSGRIDTGTLGFWVELVGKGIIGVSNYHVLAEPNARKGQRIVQPGRLDHRGSRNTIGSLLEFFQYEKDSNLVDVASLAPKNPAEANLFEIEGIGKWNGFTKAVIGMKVAKAGRTTGYTEGEIQSLDASFKTSYGEDPLLFIKQIKTTCKLEGGDSGAALVDLKSKKICGLCVAADTEAPVSYANNIRYIFGPDSVPRWKVKK